MDFSQDVHPKRSRGLRLFFAGLGWLALSLGAIGIFLPVLPTTPFLLLAAACFARSSARFYNWLMNNRLFGPYLRAWRHERRIPRHAKILAVAMIVLTIGTSILLFIPLLGAKLATAAVGGAVITYILRFPS